MRSNFCRGAILFGVLVCFAVTARAQQAEIFLVPVSGPPSIGPEQTITIDVFVRDTAPEAVQSYEVVLEIVPQPGSAGSLVLNDQSTQSIFIGSPGREDGTGRDDWIFAGTDALGFVNVSELRFAAAVLFDDPVVVTGAKYLGTYVFRAPAGTSGDFTLNLVPDPFPDEPTGPFTVLLAGFGEVIPATLTGLTVSVVDQVPNDNCENAITVNEGATPFTTISATTDGPPLPPECDEKGLDFEGDVWFDFTSTCTGVVTVSTCGSATFDTRLAVYGTGGGTCTCPTDNTNLLACDDDRAGCAGNTSEAFFNAVSGECLKLRLGGFGPETGTGTMTVTCGPDLCQDARSVSVPSSTFGSTKNTVVNDAIGPNCGLGGVNSPGVWYRVTGNGNRLTASIPSATFDTRLTVYEGTCGALSCVGEANVSGFGGETVNWCSTAGTTYLILAHGSGGARGDFTLNLSQQSCGDGNACTTDDCENGTCVNEPNFDTNQFCCAPSTGNLTPIDDGNPCTTGSCNPNTGQVTQTPVPDGPNEGCDDGFRCTLDECVSGACENIDINTLTCSSDAQCPDDIPCDLDSGFCDCVGITLELVPDPGAAPVEGCFGVGEVFTVRVMLGPTNAEFISDEDIVAAQFFLQYDTARLLFVSIEPGANVDDDSPFKFQTLAANDPLAGTIDSQVVVDPWGSGTRVPTTVAVITFEALAECSGSVAFRPSGPNDAENFLGISGGERVNPQLIGLPEIPIDSSPPQVSSCPSDIVTGTDPGVGTAVVTWTNPTASDNCATGPVSVTCTPSSGSQFGPGTTTVTCRAVDACGLEDSCTFNVEVESSILTVDVQLSPSVAPGPFERCITFDLWDCDGPPEAQHITIKQALTFVNGMASGVQLAIPGGNWECVMARDELHTLGSTAPNFSTVDGTNFTAGFTGSHATGGAWLVGGNLNGDRFIDILDFAVLFPKFLSPASPNASCGTAGPSANVNGDTLVDLLDLVFVSSNALSVSQPVCCPNAGAAASVDEDGPRLSITLDELVERGLGHLVIADVNADGVVDFQDVAAVLRGDYTPPGDGRPERKPITKPGRTGRHNGRR